MKNKKCSEKSESGKSMSKGSGVNKMESKRHESQEKKRIRKGQSK